MKIDGNTHLTVYFTKKTNVQLFKKQHQKWCKNWYIQNWLLKCDEQDIDMKKQSRFVQWLIEVSKVQIIKNIQIQCF